MLKINIAAQRPSSTHLASVLLEVLLDAVGALLCAVANLLPLVTRLPKVGGFTACAVDAGEAHMQAGHQHLASQPIVPNGPAQVSSGQCMVSLVHCVCNSSRRNAISDKDVQLTFTHL